MRLIKNTLCTRMKVVTQHKSEYRLKLNYPNPAKPSTKISYSIPSNVVLKIYDILRNEDSALVNDEKLIGPMKWSMINYPVFSSV